MFKYLIRYKFKTIVYYLSRRVYVHRYVADVK